MKSTGMVRKIDELGRIVLPVEIRRVFGIGTKDPIEIFVDSSGIFLRPYKPGCFFCGNLHYHELQEFKGYTICATCKSEMREL